MRMRDLSAIFSSLVHQSARKNPLSAARHQSFIASHLMYTLQVYNDRTRQYEDTDRVSDNLNWIRREQFQMIREMPDYTIHFRIVRH